MRLIMVGLLVVGAGLSLACAKSISDEAKEELAKPVNCDTAEQDIAALEAEKASVAEQTSAGVRSVLPAAAVVGILRGDTKDRAKVATGAYNDELDAKIAEIRETCGLSP